MAELIQTKRQVRTAMLEWLHKRWRVSRSFKMTPVLRWFDTDEAYAEPWFTKQDVFDVCSTIWGQMKSHERRALIAQIDIRWIFGQDWQSKSPQELSKILNECESALSEAEYDSDTPESVRETLLRVALQQQQNVPANDWKIPVKNAVERLRAAGATQDEMRALWDRFIEGLPPDPDITPQVRAFVYRAYKQQYDAMVDAA
jgi:hypothetical protein